MRISVLGPQGTFSDSAAKKYIEQIGEECEIVYFPTIDEAFEAVGNGCDVAIVPIENTLDGYVQRTLDLLLEMPVHIKNQVTIPVRFSLIANAESVEDINRLYVQFKSAGQCRRFVNSLKMDSVITTESNMISYYEAEKGNVGEAAIIPQHMLGDSKAILKIKDVTDADSNFTRFVVVVPGLCDHAEPHSGEIHVPMYVMPGVDRPGVLFEILREFYDKKINLTAIMSRPTKKEMGRYNFYIEASGKKADLATIIKVVEEMEGKYDIKIIGIY